jgi:hypothetical protein
MPAAPKRLCLPVLLLLLAGCGRPPADDRTRGLRMPSESDAPFKPFLWDPAGDRTHEKLLQLAHEPKGAPVEEGTLDEHFATASPV